MALPYIYFWNFKTPQDNAWHPEPGSSPPALANIPAFIKRQDLQATAVDVAPFVTGVAGLAHIRQANSFGFDAHASVFRNPKTLRAAHRAVIVLVPLVLACQAANVEYRYLIPRWSHERERRRDESEVRQHIDVGMYAGVGLWFVRTYGFGVGRAYWAPIEIVLGGAIADLAHREYYKAHDM